MLHLNPCCGILVLERNPEKMTPPAIHEFRLRIEHASAAPERQTEIQTEMLTEYSMIFRRLSPEVGVWEKYDGRRKKHKEVL